MNIRTCCWPQSSVSLTLKKARTRRPVPCASELNPVESVWSHPKRSLANLAKRDLLQLTTLAKTRLRRMQYRPGLIEGFLTGTRLDLTPLCNLRN